jgi:preprotein translocase subunit SecY
MRVFASKTQHHTKLSVLWRRTGLAIAGLVLCEIGARIVAPSINGPVLAEYLRRTGGTPLLRLYDWIVGGALSRGAVLALGVMPYLSARIIMRLARVTSPTLAAMAEAEAEQPRLRRWTRALTFGLAAVQSYGFARFAQSVPGVVANPGPLFIAQTMFVLTAGAMGVAWLGERMASPSDAESNAADGEPAPTREPAAPPLRELPPGEIPTPFSARSGRDREAERIRMRR